MNFTPAHFESSNFFYLRFVFVIYLSFVICHLSFSQPGTWVAIYGGTNYDRGRGIVQTFDKGYIVCGSTSSYGIGNMDVYLLKIDSAGKFQWHAAFGGANIENCFSVKQTSDSGFVICGSTTSFGNGGYDAYLVKIDSAGNPQWQKTFGGSDWDFSYWVEQTNDGGYILAGETFSYGNGSQAYLIKTNSMGDTLWTKTFGGTNEEAVYEVHQTLDNGYIFAGYTRSYNASDADFFLVKTDFDGDTLWTKTFGNTSDEICNSVALCKDNGFLLGGHSIIGGQKYFYFLKTASDGEMIFSKVDTPSTGNKSIVRIRETIDGQYIILVNSDVGGLGGNEILLYEWNTGGWFPWGSSFGGVNDEEGYDLQQTADSGFVLVGFTSTFGDGPDNIFIAKTNSAGGYNPATNIYVGVNEILEKNKDILFYPNPFYEKIYFKIDKSFFTDDKTFLFQMSDIFGREIIKLEKEVSTLSSGIIQIEIPCEKFMMGFYIASLQSGDKKICRKLLFAR